MAPSRREAFRAYFETSELGEKEGSKRGFEATSRVFGREGVVGGTPVLQTGGPGSNPGRSTRIELGPVAQRNESACLRSRGSQVQILPGSPVLSSGSLCGSDVTGNMRDFHSRLEGSTPFFRSSLWGQ